MTDNELTANIHQARGMLMGLEIAKVYMSLPMANSMGHEMDAVETLLTNLEYELAARGLEQLMTDKQIADLINRAEGCDTMRMELLPVMLREILSALEQDLAPETRLELESLRDQVCANMRAIVG